MEYIVNLNKFQGPFDLLFHLIEENEIEIYDIPISEITEQYIIHLDRI
jgi:segregation and condensation protein A